MAGRTSRGRGPAHSRYERASAGSRASGRSRNSRPGGSTARSGYRRGSGSRRSGHRGRRATASQRAARELRRLFRDRRVRAGVAIVAVLLAFLLVAHAMSSCGTRAPVTEQNSYDTTSSSAYQSPYDWNNLSLNDKGLYEYRVGGSVLSRVGVDVSEHQGQIDWGQVADYGVQFAYVRVGYRTTDMGQVIEDAYFDQNLSGARAAGLKVGVYFYSQATTADEAREEADFVADRLNNADVDYPVAFDLEPTNGSSNRASGLDQDTYTQVMKAFCDEANARGYQACVYGNTSDLANYDLESLANYPIWIAGYGSVPRPMYDFTMWQYSNSGNLPGVDTSVDMDLDLAQAYQAARG